MKKMPVRTRIEYAFYDNPSIERIGKKIRESLKEVEKTLSDEEGKKERTSGEIFRRRTGKNTR